MLQLAPSTQASLSTNESDLQSSGLASNSIVENNKQFNNNNTDDNHLKRMESMTTTLSGGIMMTSQQPSLRNQKKRASPSATTTSPMQSGGVGSPLPSSATSTPSPLSAHSKKSSSPNTPHHVGKIEDEEGYVRNLLEMSRSRRRKKKQELLEAFQHFRSEMTSRGDVQREEEDSYEIDVHDDEADHFDDHQLDDDMMYRDEGLEDDHEHLINQFAERHFVLHPQKASYEPSLSSSLSHPKQHNEHSSFSSCQSSHHNKETTSSSPSENHHYFAPTVSSEVRRVATNFAHQQYKHLSDDRSSYLLKRIEELKNMNIKAMLESVSSRDTFTSILDASGNNNRSNTGMMTTSNKSRSSSPSSTSHSNHNFSSRLVNDVKSLPVNMPPSPKGSKHYEQERRKRIVARNNFNYEEQAREELNLIPEEIPEYSRTSSPHHKNNAGTSPFQRTTSPLQRYTLYNSSNSMSAMTPTVSSKSPMKRSSSLHCLPNSSADSSKVFTPRPGSSSRIRTSSSAQSPSRCSSNNINNSRTSFSAANATTSPHRRLHSQISTNRSNFSDHVNTNSSKTGNRNVKSPRSGHSPHYRAPSRNNNNISNTISTPKSNRFNSRNTSSSLTHNDNIQFDRQEKLILEEILNLDQQLNKSSVFKNIVSNLDTSSNLGTDANADSASSTPKTPRNVSRMTNGHACDASNDDQNSSFTSLNRSGNFSNTSGFLNPRPFTPSSRASSRSGAKTPSSQPNSNRTRPAGFDPKELTLEEIARKNREKYAHVKPKVVSHRASTPHNAGTLMSADSTSLDAQNGYASKIITPKQRPSSASSNKSITSSGQLNNTTTELSSTPKRSSSLSKSRSTSPQSTTTSVNVKLRNILIENDEYKRVWGEIEREELRILKFKTAPTLNDNTPPHQRPDKSSTIVNSSESPDFQPSPNAPSKPAQSANNGINSAVQAMMDERIRSIEEGLRKIASSYDLDIIDGRETCPNSYSREDYATEDHIEDHPHDKTLLEEMESKYCILQDNPQKETQIIHSNKYVTDSEQIHNSFGEDDAAVNSSIEEAATIKQNTSSHDEHYEIQDEHQSAPFLLNDHSRNSTAQNVTCNESMLSVNASLLCDLSQMQSNPDFRKFINDKLDKIERECTLRQQQQQLQKTV
ncbi:hypothetical protein C9374_009996 [Naegleria lovaniensis]|uniref:Uncharacterized protein n=1 Tax=Naegleria lovaniensis TaxID=51637 RepID=A0AA88GI71_NAELO|nr:uncharacterized protein C9374_009996 [Naegleria lovaniensis]KAG2375373.1 hypothetical protein C9374_009996 [Naegleria lovaniensis]